MVVGQIMKEDGAESASPSIPDLPDLIGLIVFTFMLVRILIPRCMITAYSHHMCTDASNILVYRVYQLSSDLKISNLHDPKI